MGPAAAISAKTTNAINAEVAARKTSQQRINSMNSAFMAGTFALTSLAGAGSMAGGALGSVSQKIMQFSGLIFGLSSIIQLLTGEKIISQIMKFKFALGPTAIALAAAGALFMIYNDKRKKEIEYMDGFSNALRSTTEQTKMLGDFFGVVPLKLPRQLQGLEAVDTKTRTAREAFKQDSNFKKDYESTIKTLSSSTASQAIILLKSLALDLKAKGFADEQIQILVDSLREEAKKTDVKLEVKSLTLDPASINQLKKDIQPLFDKVNKEVNKPLIIDIKPLTGGTTIQTQRSRKEEEKALKDLQNTIISVSESAAGMFTNNLIDATKFEETMYAIVTPLTTLEKKAREAALIEIFKSMGVDATKFITNLKSAKDLMMGLSLVSGGILSPDSNMFKDLGSDVFSIREAAMIRLKRAYAEFIKVEQAANDAEGPDGTVTGGDSEKGKVNAIKAKTEAILQQTESYKILRNQNIDNATATELSNDAEIAALVILAAKNGTLPKTISLIKDLTKATKLQTAATEAGMSAEEKFKSSVSKELALLNLRDKLVEIQYSADLKKDNDELSIQEEKLKKINNEIDEKNRKEIDPLQAQIAANNFALESVARQEDAINKKYDTQINALDKIASINQDINNIQKQRMSIADALTRGDISAAAQAVQEARAQQAESAISGQRTALTAGRDSALGALGRNTLEQKNKDLQYQISVIENGTLLTLKNQKIEIENSIRTTQALIAVTEGKIKKDQEALGYVTRTREELEKFDDLIKLAEDAGIELNAQLLAETGSAKKLADALYEVAKARAAGLGGPVSAGPGTDTITTQPGDVEAKIANLALLKTKIEKKVRANDKVQKPATTPKLVPGTGRYDGSTFIPPVYRSMGGLIPKYMAGGGFARGTDTVPAMLTPGEFVVKKFAVDSFGVDNLRDINNGTFNKSNSDGNTSSSVYNYGINVNVSNSNASTDEIARAVITQIKNIDNQRIRSQRY
jgi:hypothetical protein